MPLSQPRREPGPAVSPLGLLAFCKVSLGTVARLALVGCALVLATDGAAARRRHHATHPASEYSVGRPGSDYYDLPYRVHLNAGNLNILRRQCDDTYPMDESMPCDTATGGPPGGRGS